MAYLMREGSGKAVALYTACADETYCKAELLVLLEKAPPDARVLGFYDVDPDMSVERFVRAYSDRGNEEDLNRMLVKVRLGGFNFKEVGIRRLTPGADQPLSTPEQLKQRISDLRSTVEHYLPDFVRGVREIGKAKGKDAPTMLLHQDAFAAGYHDDEYVLLGMAIKYAGLNNVTVTVIPGKGG